MREGEDHRRSGRTTGVRNHSTEHYEICDRRRTECINQWQLKRQSIHPPWRRRSGKSSIRTTIELAGMLPVLFVICVLFSVLTPNFLHENNIVNVIRQASINIVLAAGMTFVILTGGIDLAVGSVLGFTAVIAVVVSLIPGLSGMAVPAALFVGLLVGVLTGATVAYIGLPPFIVTLGTYTAIRGAAYLAAGGTTVINRRSILPGSATAISVRYPGWSSSPS